LPYTISIWPRIQAKKCHFAILREGFSWAELYVGNGRWRRLAGIIHIDYPFADSISEAEAEDLIRQLDK
jgi:hypothetical protein